MHSMVRNLLLFCASVLLTLPGVCAQELPLLACPSSKPGQQTGKYAGYAVRLSRSAKRGERCQALVTPLVSKAGQAKTVARDWALSINRLSGSDINGDGKPELIVQGYSGGAHCCYTYRIISLSGGLPLVREIHDQVPVLFVRRDDGSTEIHAGDGVFDYFLLPHSDSVIPQIFLRLDGDKLVDISGEHVVEYDKQIEKAHNELAAADLDKLRKSTYNQNMLYDQLPTVQKVLVIVLNYLYSGRDDQAWQALGEMWPPADVERVKKLILERRSRGLLSQVAQKSQAGS
jgi:hypothetical protein